MQTTSPAAVNTQMPKMTLPKEKIPIPKIPVEYVEKPNHVIEIVNKKHEPVEIVKKISNVVAENGEPSPKTQVLSILDVGLENKNVKSNVQPIGNFDLKPLEQQPLGDASVQEPVISPTSPPVNIETPSIKKQEDNTITSNEKPLVKKEVKVSVEPKKPALPFKDLVWEYPGLDLISLTQPQKPKTGDVERRKSIIQSSLGAFGINCKVAEVNIGPSVTQYAIDLEEGTPVQKITKHQHDLALSLASPNGQVRIEAPIPGRSLIGIEVPNDGQEVVPLRAMLETSAFKNMRKESKLTLCLGKDIRGQPTFYPLDKMPHLLIAGQTGSGKSVMIHSIIDTLLYSNSPSECQFILIDPKRVEMEYYNGIPHLKTPVITDCMKAMGALNWAVSEMENRLDILQKGEVRDIGSYNKKAGFQAMPYLVIIVDELSELMMITNKEVEKPLIRIAQLARATGIHLVIATQRPDANIVTGALKANIPTKIAFNVASGTNSKVIIDGVGAEKLLGKGDMLFLRPDSSVKQRIQGVFIDEPEIKSLVEFIKNNGAEPEYDESIVNYSDTKNNNSVTGSNRSTGGGGDFEDELFMEAAELVMDEGKASTSFLQRRLSIGYSRAARIVDELEKKGVIGGSNGSKGREILVDSLTDLVD